MTTKEEAEQTHDLQEIKDAYDASLLAKGKKQGIELMILQMNALRAENRRLRQVLLRVNMEA